MEYKVCIPNFIYTMYILICFSDRHGSSALTGEGVVVTYLVLPVTLFWNRQIKC